MAGSGGQGMKAAQRVFRCVFLPALLLAAALAISGCGYKVSGGGMLPGGITRVAVTIFENRSGETNVEGIFSSDIIYELTRNGKTVVSSLAAAEAGLSGTIVSVTTRSIARQSIHDAVERRVTATVSLKLSDATGRVIWQADRITENEAYAVVEDKGASEQNKRQALSKLSRRLAERAYHRMTDAF